MKIAGSFFLINFFSVTAFGASYDVDPSGFYGGFPCYTTIQSAINGAANGDVINIHAGTYQENITINKDLTLSGDGSLSTFLLPAVSDIGSVANLGSGIAGSDIILIQAPNVTIKNLTVDGSNPFISGTEATVNGVTIDARNGIITDYRTAVNYPNITIDNVTVKNIFERGIEFVGPAGFVSGNTVKNCTIQNIEGNAGSSGLFYYFADGQATNNQLDHAAFMANWSQNLTLSFNTILNSPFGIQISNAGGVVITNNTIDSKIEGSTGIEIFQSENDNAVSNNTIRNCSFGIAVLGSYSNRLVALTDNIINGNTGIPALPTSIGIYSSTEVTGYAPGTNIRVAISGNNTIANVNTGIIAEASDAERDNLLGPITTTDPGTYNNTTTISGVQFTNIAGNYIQLQTHGAASTISNIDATANHFDAYGTTQADGFAIEDKILHKLDDPTLSTSITDGLVTFIPNQLFTTGNQGNTSIQRLIDAAPADGWTIQVKAGPDYSAQDLTAARSFDLDGDGAILVNSMTMNGAGKTVTLHKDLSLVSSLDLTNGIITTGTNKLSLENTATVTGGSDASHVNGYVEKTGNAAFIFPIGDGTTYRPCSISAPALATDAFMAKYYPLSPRANLAPGTINTPGAPAMLWVSDKEYWDIQQTSGSSTVDVNLTWKDVTTSGPKNADADLVVASHTAAGWDNLQQASASMSAGLVWVQNLQPVTQYGSFALGSINTLTTLPVHFTYFTLTVQEGTALLQWGVANASEVGSFSIMHSTDGEHFYPLQTVLPSGSGYSYTHSKPVAGSNYYRIKAIDLQGKPFFTATKEWRNGQYEVKVLCNGKQLLHLPYAGTLSANTHLQVAAMNGCLYSSLPVPQTNREVNLTIKDQGMYIIYLVDNTGARLSTKKVLVDHR